MMQQYHRPGDISLDLQPRPGTTLPDNFSYVFPVEDKLDHISLQPFCWDKTCPCHEDDEAITTVYQAVQDGLITPEEATDFVLGKLL